MTRPPTLYVIHSDPGLHFFRLFTEEAADELSPSAVQLLHRGVTVHSPLCLAALGTTLLKQHQQYPHRSSPLDLITDAVIATRGALALHALAVAILSHPAPTESLRRGVAFLELAAFEFGSPDLRWMMAYLFHIDIRAKDSAKAKYWLEVALPLHRRILHWAGFDQSIHANDAFKRVRSDIEGWRQLDVLSLLRLDRTIFAAGPAS